MSELKIWLIIIWKLFDALFGSNHMTYSRSLIQNASTEDRPMTAGIHYSGVYCEPYSTNPLCFTCKPLTGYIQPEIERVICLTPDARFNANAGNTATNVAETNKQWTSTTSRSKGTRQEQTRDRIMDGQDVLAKTEKFVKTKPNILGAILQTRSRRSVKMQKMVTSNSELYQEDEVIMHDDEAKSTTQRTDHWIGRKLFQIGKIGRDEKYQSLIETKEQENGKYKEPEPPLALPKEVYDYGLQEKYRGKADYLYENTEVMKSETKPDDEDYLDGSYNEIDHGIEKSPQKYRNG